MPEKIYLLIDFGASRIKSATLIDGQISNVQSHSSVEPCDLKEKKFEVDLFKIKNKFLNITENYYAKTKFDGIFVCSEMHGFALLNKYNEPISNYISWKDERCTNEIDGISSFKMLQTKLGKSFFEKTGMNPKACYPIFNLFHVIRKKDLKCAKIVSLPEWLCCCSNKSLNIAHSTMSAGLGFYNIHTNSFDEKLVEAVSQNRTKLMFNKPSSSIEIGGYLNIDGKDIPIYTGVGDHQCAVLGAGNDSSSISVNLGTGSQVAMIDLNNDFCEKRPFFDGEILSVITHIPSGRVLSQFEDILRGINPGINYWDELAKITITDIKNANFAIDLAIFESAWGYSGNKSIPKPDKNNFDLKNYLASILKCYINQYKKAIDTLKPTSKFNKIILSGGIANKLPVIKEYLNEITGYKIILSNNEFDETFMGLTRLAQQSEGCKIC